LIVEGLLD